MKPWSWALLGVLLLARVPSLAQPAGADQGLYAYVGQRIASGEFPYRDAWDQKPPAIHYTYALMFALWPRDAVVAAADLLTAAAVAVLLVALGRRMKGRLADGGGGLAAILFLLFGNPVYTRLGGVRIRSQCETFIALAVAAAVLALVKSLGVGQDWAHGRRQDNLRWSLAAGCLLGIAFIYKYNALVYAALVPAAVVWLLLRQPGADVETTTTERLVFSGLGFAIPTALMLALFGLAGALPDLYEATVRYNLQYSGETYAGPAGFIRYLLTFPIGEARVDVLWLLGGAGCLVLLLTAGENPAFLLAPMWTAVACLSIAINGSRGLPQYFVQAAPALALSAGLAGALVWNRTIWPARVVLVALVAIAAWRVTPFDKAIDYTLYDLKRLEGRTSEDVYLSRFGGERSAERAEKYLALDQAKLGALLQAKTSPTDKVLIFGFSSGAYVQAHRQSASRFFWSRPVIVEFNAGKRGYGPQGLLDDLKASRPRLVVLQRNDWELEGIDSAGYFLKHGALSGWLRAEYEHAGELNVYDIWTRREARASGLVSRPSDSWHKSRSAAPGWQGARSAHSGTM
ncbi:MAG: hypothetical protein HYS05_06570 [Acidobacteria bacterium]|nr:hypothetical protein [Acidobacteriota bacterium]